MSGGTQAALPQRLVEAFRQRRAAVFVGAGASVPAGMPSWQTLVGRLAEEISIEPESRVSDGTAEFSPRQLASIPQFYENRLGRRSLIAALRSHLPRRAPGRSDIHGLLADLPCDLYYTTNFDTLLEDALSHNGRDEYDLVVTEADARDYSGHAGCQVRKLHGTRAQAETVVLTRSDYARYALDHPLMMSRLTADLRERTFLFIGYSLADPDFNSVYDSAFYTMRPMHIQHYICSFELDAHERTDLIQRGLEVIELGRRQDSEGDEPLGTFLRQLVTESNEAFHVRRFFSSVGRGSDVPIIVSSRPPDETYQHDYFPACDIRAAQVIQDSLRLLGATGHLRVDREAVQDFERIAGGDLVLVCSPFGNAVAKEIFAQIDRARGRGDAPIDLTFTHDADAKTRTIVSPRASYTAVNPRDNPAGPGTEYAVIARIRNPWAPGAHIFLFAGLHTLGTTAVTSFLQDPSNYGKIPATGAAAGVVLEISYTGTGPSRTTELDVIPLFPQQPGAWTFEIATP